MTKIMRFQIIKPLNIDYEIFYTILNTLKKETRMLKNKTIQKYYEWNNFSNQHYKESGEYPKIRDFYNYNTVDGWIYNELKNSVEYMVSSNVNTSIRDAFGKYNSSYKEILSGEKSILSFKRDLPLDIYNKGVKIYKEHGEYTNYMVLLSLLSTKGKKLINEKLQETNKNPLKTGQISCVIKVGDNTQKCIVERCLSGEYKISASQLIKSKNKWFLNLTYTFEKDEELKDKSRVMGIDMGVVNAVYIAFNFDKYKRYSIDGKPVMDLKSRLHNERSRDKRARVYCANGSIGHGIHTRLKRKESLDAKISNITNTTNHKWSRYIVDVAVKNGVGTIQMENLSGIDVGNNFLKSWTYYDLQQKVKYKAIENGIAVKLILPKFTSQRCNKCGFIHMDNRKTQSEFGCVECGYKANADFNAAQNIATPDIEYIIEEQCRIQGITYKNGNKKVL